MTRRPASRRVIPAVIVTGLLLVPLLAQGLAVPATASPGDGVRVGGAASGAGAEPDRMQATERPRVTGVTRYGRTLRATQGRWSRPPEQVRFQWLRDGRPIRGARGQRHRVQPADVGSRLSVRVTARNPRAVDGPRGEARSRPTRPIGHRVPVRRTVTYQVETRGDITSNLRTFRREAQQTYDDPRGWRDAGVRFVPVARGGDFSLVLAEAGEVPRFSSGCSAQYSCRVGRYVIINQDRWRTATRPWNRAGGSLRGYRHMVVNHETGHWLGRGHLGCPGPGRLAPVMMQQSKGLDGCRFNPWPTRAELR